MNFRLSSIGGISSQHYRPRRANPLAQFALLIALTSTGSFCGTRSFADDTSASSRLSNQDKEKVEYYISRSSIPGDAWKHRALEPIERFGTLQELSEIILQHFLATRRWELGADTQSDRTQADCAKILEILLSWNNIRSLHPAAAVFAGFESPKATAMLRHLNFSKEYIQKQLDDDLYDWLISRESGLVKSMPDLATIARRYGRKLDKSYGLYGLQVFLPGGINGNNPYQLTAQNNIAFLHVENFPGNFVQLLEDGNYSRNIALFLKGSKYVVVECDFKIVDRENRNLHSHDSPHRCRLVDVVSTPIRQYSYVDSASELNGFHFVVEIDVTKNDRASTNKHVPKLYGLVEFITQREHKSRLNFLELSSNSERVRCEFQTAERYAVPTFLELMR